jgi:MinD superfamily P-loop ATPase
VKLCVLSGKGGTGKTTVAAGLAKLAGWHYIDCDVEEPNGFIFLKPTDISGEEVTVEHPVIDADKCTLCKRCGEVCRFHALVTTKKGVMAFDRLCHACGACALVCEPEAIRYGRRRIGLVEQGLSGNIIARRGVLDVGEQMPVPVIRQLLENLPDGVCVLDCPPGTSCSVATVISHADYALLVTEPSAFGLHDLDLAVKLLQSRGMPFGVVINKHTPDEKLVSEYCRENGIPIWGTIPYSREAAEVYSAGRLLNELPVYRGVLESIAEKVKGGAPAWN